MIKPELHEVHEYFKDAIIIRSISGTEFENTNDFRYSIFNHNSGIYTQDGMREVWNERQGYAKILSYKTQKFEITKEQILEMAEWGNSKDNEKVRGWFPEAFKTELIVGKWYKWVENNDVYLWYITKIENKEIHCYGFSNINWIDEGIGYTKKYYKEVCKELKEATTEEVKEALIAEAKKRGFDKGISFINASGNEGKLCKLKGINFEIGFCGRNNLHERDSEGIIFESGKWAEIIRVKEMTQSEIEKELGYKIKII